MAQSGAASVLNCNPIQGGAGGAGGVGEGQGATAGKGGGGRRAHGRRKRVQHLHHPGWAPAACATFLPGVNGGAGDGIDLAGGGVVINGYAGQLYSPLIEGLVGVYAGAGGAATVVNYATIDGSGGTSVLFKSASDRLVAESGADFIGAVKGGGGGLVLAGGTGVITGLGGVGTLTGDITANFGGFGTYVIATGADWTLSGTNTLAAGGELFDEGTMALASGPR